MIRGFLCISISESSSGSAVPTPSSANSSMIPNDPGEPKDGVDCDEDGLVVEDFDTLFVDHVGCGVSSDNNLSDLVDD